MRYEEAEGLLRGLRPGVHVILADADKAFEIVVIEALHIDTFDGDPQDFPHIAYSRVDEEAVTDLSVYQLVSGERSILPIDEEADRGPGRRTR